MAFGECDGSTSGCSDGFKAFEASCENLAVAIVKGSSGDRSDVSEYMSDVCAEDVLQDWHRDRCISLGAAITSAMSIDTASNRDDFASKSVCGRLWTQLQTDAKARVEKERAARAAAAAQAAQEAQARAAQEAAEEKAAEEQKAAEEKAAEEQKSAEEQRRQEQQRERVAEESRQQKEEQD